MKRMLLPIIKSDIEKDKLYYPQSFRYVIGLLYACKIRREIHKSNFSVHTIFAINELLGKSDRNSLEVVLELQDLGITLIKRKMSDRAFY